MKRIPIVVCATTLFAAATLSATETQFPPATRMLKVDVPSNCAQWTPPRPVERINVEYPVTTRSSTGQVAMLIRIGSGGEYKGVVDTDATEAVFAREVENSIKKWTFTPAMCNGQQVEIEARVDFVFKRESPVSYRY